jgi:hypothetical protein
MIDEAHMVLAAWKAERIIRSGNVFANKMRLVHLYFRDFLCIVERHLLLYATRPLLELLEHHPPRTLVDAADCMRRVAAEVARLKYQVAGLQRTWSPNSAMLLIKVG